MAKRLVVVLVSATIALASKCPGSAAFIHASCSVQADSATSCDNVMEEMKARIEGQYKAWHDPHNNGTYKILSEDKTELLVTRTSGAKSFGGKTYTDKVLFELSQSADGCSVSACSESQGTSVGDFSTNYCNIRNLYCGSAEGCKPIKHDFSTKESSVLPSVGASKDASMCAPVLGAKDDIGGVFTDPNHYKPGTLAGVRMISGNRVNAPSSDITLVGSDDGETFWTLHGTFTSAARSALVIDFSPKGGPAGLMGAYVGGRITFQDGNQWSKLAAPEAALVTVQGGGVDLGGFYTDPNHYKQGTFAGTRMVSGLQGDAPSESVMLVGSDDGAAFWTILGHFTSEAHDALEIDFSPKGGPKLAATFADGRITFADGNAWPRHGHLLDFTL